MIAKISKKRRGSTWEHLPGASKHLPGAPRCSHGLGAVDKCSQVVPRPWGHLEAPARCPKVVPRPWGHLEAPARCPEVLPRLGSSRQVPPGSPRARAGHTARGTEHRARGTAWLAAIFGTRVFFNVGQTLGHGPPPFLEHGCFLMWGHKLGA